MISLSPYSAQFGHVARGRFFDGWEDRRKLDPESPAVAYVDGKNIMFKHVYKNKFSHRFNDICIESCGDRSQSRSSSSKKKTPPSKDRKKKRHTAPRHTHCCCRVDG
jgi:hypothetical protein